MADPEAEKTEALSQKILDNARKQAQKTIDRAEREAEKQLAKAESEGQKEAEQILAGARKRADVEATKIAAAIPLEVKRKTLEAQEAVLRAMIESGVSAAVRASDEDPDTVLAALLLDAALIMHENNLIVEANEKDRARISAQMLSNVASRVKDRQGRAVVLTLSDEAVPISGGVVVRSASGRLLCDNSFESRLDRSRAELRLKLAKALFDEQEE